MTVDTRPSGGIPRRILVVEDDARVRRALCDLILASPGLLVAGHVRAGPAALGADEEVAPDVVLLDVGRPSADEGLEMLTCLVARGRAVVALSSREALRTSALTAGAAAFVEKSAGPDALLGALREVPLMFATRR